LNRIVALLIAALIAVPATLAFALPEQDAVDVGVAYILPTQQDDGGFGGFGPGQTFDAVLAIRSAGIDPATVASASGKTPADYLAANAASQTMPSAAAKAALAAIAMDMDPRNVGGTDLVAAIEGPYDPSTGRHEESDFSEALALIGLAAVDADIPKEAIDSLVATRIAGEGWGFDGATSDIDTTAVVIQGLIAAGLPASDAAITGSVDWLLAGQNADGGFGTGGASNANSTAVVIQALLAAGVDPEGEEATSDSGATPVSYLLDTQQDDGTWAGFDPVYSALQAVPALAGVTMLESATAPITKEAPDPPATTATPTATAASSPTTTASATPAAPVIGTGLAATDTGFGGEEAFTLAALGLIAMAGAFIGLARYRQGR
jgi:hypothetical protein